MRQLYSQLLSNVLPFGQKATILTAASLFTLAVSAQSVKHPTFEAFSSTKKVEFVEQRNQVEMQVSSKIVVEKLSLHIPQNWTGKEVVFELFSDNGQIIQKIIEHKSSRIEILDMNPLAAGSYLIKASCASEFAMQTVIHAQQL